MRRPKQHDRRCPSIGRRKGISRRIPSRKELKDRADVAAAVFARFGFRCMAADLEFGPCFGGLTLHHLKKASQGGKFTASNLVPLCSSHNTQVEDEPVRARMLGLVVASWEPHP